ncbi:MAG: carboxypeptidase regulatory-like domain-containing protein [Myxococcales bacterium]|nr:carboxypeptidase regulatory-like domain-containing protein [Myxococcales bacterium]
MRSLRLLAPLLVLSACGPTQPPEPTCTDGCFASSGSCIKAADQIDTLCGLSGGGSCQNCVTQGLVCQKGFGCTRGPNVGGGSAAGGTAGGDAAGGSAAGGAAAGGAAAGGAAAGGLAAGGSAAGGSAAGGSAAGGSAAGGSAAGGSAAGGSAAGGSAAGGSAAGGSAAGGSAAGGSAAGGSAAGGSATCVNLCSGSVSICDSAGVRTCQIDRSGCSVFGAPQACPSTQSCSGGSCQSTCTNQCSLNATQCASSGAPVRCQTLSNGCTDWVLQTTCSPGQVCSGGSCVSSTTCTNQCTLGMTRCTSGGQQQTCVTLASGCTDWSLPVACNGGQTCASPRTTCAVPQCTAGQRRCTTAGAPGVETCDAQGTWYVTSQCPQACAAGACTAAAACSAGTVRCNGTNIEICNASGTAWLYNQTCAVACTAGVCTGPCTPNQKRCNGNVPETCNAGGSAWVAAQSCMNECYNGECTQNDLVIDGTTQTLEGDLKFSNSVTIRNQGQLRVGPSGVLRLRARSITIESNTTINANDLGTETRGEGGSRTGTCSYCSGIRTGSFNVGSSYGTRAANGSGFASYFCCSGCSNGCSVSGSAPDPYDAEDDLSISMGSRYNGATRGGGLVQLIADAVTVNGQITANATSAGASGGGVLIAANQISGTGVIQTSGAATSPTGGNGRVKLLRGTTNNFFSGNITGNNRASPMPPLDLVSGSHPDQSKWYNDGLGDWFAAWSRPFQSLTGYYWRLSTSASTLPSAAAGNGTLIMAESIQVPAAQLVQGRNFIHIVSVDSAFNVGTVKATATVQVNTQPPTITSTSHPVQRTWGGTPGLFFSWTNPQADSNFNGYYFTLDRYADTIPAATPTNFTSNKQVLLANTPDGIWGFHVVNRDTRGAITKAAAHYIVYVGANPGVGNVSGSAYDGSMGNAALSGVTLTINRGFFSQTTASNGTYTFSNLLPAGTWELTASKTGYVSQTVTVTVAAAGSVNQNFTLLRAP